MTTTPTPTAPQDEYEDLVHQHRVSDDDSKKNPWLERILSPKTKGNATLSWPEVGGHPRFFVLRSLGRKNIHAAMNVWMNVVFKNNEWIAAPFISPVPMAGWYETNPKSGRTYLRKVVPECPMGALLGSPKEEVLGRDYSGKKVALSPFYYVEAFEIEFEWSQVTKDGKTVWTAKQDPAKPGWPLMKVNPKAYILALRPQMFLQLKDKILVPKPVEAAVDALTGEATAPTLPPLPSNDPTQIMVKLEKIKKVDNPTGDPQKDVLYTLSYHPKFTFDSKSIQEVEPLPRTSEGFIDWPQIFPAVDQEEVNRVITGYFGGEAPEARPASPGEAARAAANGNEGKPADGQPATDDDIPF